MHNLETPILFLTFNRPDKTARVFDMIKEAQPAKLYLASDGPREDRTEERELVLETRKILANIDWPCEVHKLYRDENLGCKKAVASALNWFFEQEESGIILEDDCLPDLSFFSFTEKLLEQYSDDPRIFHINGSNFLSEKSANLIDTSYYFSKNVHVWGWATWRRAWQHYHIDMDGIDESEVQEKIKSQFTDSRIGNFWISLFRHIRNKKVNTWDAQWAYTVLRLRGICITPKVNLIENIGFDRSSTHTETSSVFQKHAQERGTIHTDHLVAPEHDESADEYQIREDFDEEVSYALYIRGFWQKAWAKFKSVI